MKKTGLFAGAFCCMALLSAPLFARTSPFLFGADVSYISRDEAGGTIWMDKGVATPILRILTNHKFNLIRLRLFYDPTAPIGGSTATTGAVYAGYSSEGYCGLKSTIAMAKRVKAAGFLFSLDFHYSDNWADPGKQYKPHAWANASFAALTDSVRFYTRNTLIAFRDSGALPQYVQVGNEISSGMIWPDGSTSNWNNFATLMKAGIQGVKDVDTTIKIVMHIDRGGDNNGTRNWVDNAVSRGVVFDILGESCYTAYQGPSSGWRTNFTDLVTRYPKYKFYIAEYSTEKRAANDIMFNLPNERGIASIIWEPLDYSERIFSKSGNTYTSVPNLINLYDTLSALYGNDTIKPTGARNVGPVEKQPGYSIANALAWASGMAPLQVYCPAASTMEFSFFSSNGRLLRTFLANGEKGMNRFTGKDNVRSLPCGLYILLMRVDGAVRAEQVGIK